jgi:hypothetical protein
LLSLSIKDASPLTPSLSPAGRGKDEGASFQRNKRICIRAMYFLKKSHPFFLPHFFLDKKMLCDNFKGTLFQNSFSAALLIDSNILNELGGGFKLIG